LAATLIFSGGVSAGISTVCSVLTVVFFDGFPQEAHIKNDNKTVLLKLDKNNII
jgi:hypothetical protein